MKHKEEKKQGYTFLIAFYLCIPAINVIGVAIRPSLAGVLMSMLYVITGSIIAFVFFREVMKSQEVASLFFVVAALISGFYILTLLAAPYSDLKMVKFVTMTLIAVMCPYNKRIDVRRFVEYVMTIPAFGILLKNRIFTVKGARYETITMGLSYAFLPSIICAIVFFVYYFWETRKKVLYGAILLINVVYLIQVLQFGSRGPVLCILTCIGFCICVRYESTGGVRIASWKLLLISVSMVFLMANLWSIAGFLTTFLGRYGIQINAINKLFRLQNSTNDISNGRLLIWRTVAKEITKKPIWGHGFSTTLHNLHFAYPHNFILQFLYDGGIVLTIPIVIFVTKGIICWVKDCSKDHLAYGVALFFMSVPGALFSGDIWENGRLWFALSYFILYGAYSRGNASGYVNTSEVIE